MRPRLLIVCFLLSATAAFAQVETAVPQEEMPAQREETAVPQLEAKDIERVEDSVETKSPLGAVLRSAVLPGWGQFYNESYWKVPIVLGISGWMIYGIISEHQNFLDYRDRYEATITEDNPAGDLRLKRFREFYRDNRDTYGWWLLVTYLLQIADAYVDAALFSFDVSEESSVTLLPAPAGAAIQWRF
ncbi:MAG: hypothetical protein JXA28_10075 [Bacteroidetes bacterium]|nr:hypothetical protein [Bacteroidota bacterium]